MKLVDGIVLVIDCVEGIMMHTKYLLQHAIIIEGLPIVVVMSSLVK
jgi:predicted membrane GTPase involved in stress response